MTEDPLQYLVSLAQQRENDRRRQHVPAIHHVSVRLCAVKEWLGARKRTRLVPQNSTGRTLT